MELCSYLTCSEIDNLQNIINNVNNRKKSDIKSPRVIPEEEIKISDEKVPDNEAFLHNLFYKVVYISSQISAIEAVNYIQNNPGQSNILAIKEFFDKNVFTTLFCFVETLEKLVICIKKVEGDQPAYNALDFIINNLILSLTQFISNRDKIKSFSEVNKFFMEQINIYFATLNEKCSVIFLKDMQDCQNKFEVLLNEIDKPINPQDVKVKDGTKLSVVKSYISNQKYTIVEDKNKKIKVINTIEEEASELPELKTDVFRRLGSSICNFTCWVKGYLPTPIRTALYVFYKGVKVALPFIPLSGCGVQAVRLAVGILGVVDEKTLDLLDNTVKTIAITERFSSQYAAIGDIANVFSTNPNTTDMSDKDKEKIINRQQKLLMTVYNNAITYVDKQYRKKIKNKKALEIEQKLILEAEENKKIIQLETEEKERKVLQRQTELIDYEYSLKLKEKEDKVMNFVTTVLKDLDIATGLKEQYKNISKPVLFFMRRNEEQKANIEKQKAIIRKIRKSCLDIMSLMTNLDINGQLYTICCNLLEDVKDTSKMYFLGIEEVYNFFDEEMNEEKTGWSYDILNSISSRFPNLMSKEKKKAITTIIEPAEQFNMNYALLSGLSLATMVRIRGLGKNAKILTKMFRNNLKEKGIISKAGRKAVIPPFEDMGITVRKGIGGTSLLAGNIAFNAYLYGNLLQKTVKNEKEEN